MERDEAIHLRLKERLYSCLHLLANHQNIHEGESGVLSADYRGLLFEPRIFARTGSDADYTSIRNFYFADLPKRIYSDELFGKNPTKDVCGWFIDDLSRAIDSTRQINFDLGPLSCTSKIESISYDTAHDELIVFLLMETSNPFIFPTRRAANSCEAMYMED